MTIYKDTNGDFHDDMNGTALHLLPPGCVPASDDEVAARRAPSPAQIIAQYEGALDAHLDSVAQAHRFKDRHSLSLRAAYLNDWQALGAAFGSWMDGCNVQAYGLLQEVQDGKKTMPTVEQFIAALPEFVAP